MSNSTELLHPHHTLSPIPGAERAPSDAEVFALAEKLLNKLQQPEQLRSKLGEIIDVARDRLEQVIITPAEHQGASIALGGLIQFLRGNLADRGQVLTHTRNLNGVLGKAGDLPLARAINAGVNALIKRTMAH